MISTLFSFSQNPVPGYMISAYGDTAKGFLKLNYIVTNHELVFNSDSYIEFYDSAGQMLNSKNNTWKGFGIFTNNGSHHFVKIITEGLFGKINLFVERVLLGKISVFKRFYYSATPNSSLIKYEYYLQKNSGVYYLFKFELLSNRKIILKELFSDCENIKKKVKADMDEKKTFNLILEYNNTCN
ncbi:MAG: hypothetical protein IPP48_04900 [Chitinophagaceae bacterium]|nr:hypothetical protein [Chitinophagaceae bacterium]